MANATSARAHAVAPYVPAPRTSDENVTRRHRAPSLGELIESATLVIRRDSLAPSGHLVAQVSHTAARHQHAVWQLGPFALLDDGWFGIVRGSDVTADVPRWLRSHERRCADQHWTQFTWIDTTLLDTGCGGSDSGIGLTSDGPTYCSGGRGSQRHPLHVPLAEVFDAGLRTLAVEAHR